MHLSIVSSYPPKRCGVGEFCQDLLLALSHLPTPPSYDIYAIDDKKAGYPYGSHVKTHFYFREQRAYKRIAEEINASTAKLCLLQHEFNLFGGKRNEYIFDLLENLQKPVVIVIHNIPISKSYRRFLSRVKHVKQLCRYNVSFVTMSEFGRQALLHYGCPEDRTFTILHGSPKMPPLTKKEHLRKELGLKPDNFIVTEFGLMRPKKGLEHLLRATKRISYLVPNVKTLVIGTQDKNDRSHYLQGMQHYAKAICVEPYVEFIEEYLGNDKINNYIVASDVIVTPYQRKDQVSSGVLTFAVHAGIPVISTPYLFAQELLETIGLFIPFYDSMQLSRKLAKLALDTAFYEEQQKRTLQFGKQLSWDAKGKEYMDVFHKTLALQETR